MKCPKCLNPLLNGAAFCNRCGAPIQRQDRRLRYAGFWRRLLAWFLDLILLAPLAEYGKEVYYLWSARWDTTGVFELARRLTPAERMETDTVMLKQMAAVCTILFFIAAPYFILCESSCLQGTIGKWILGIRVTDLDGRRLGRTRAVLRYVCKLVSAMPMYFGFVMILFQPRKQGLHDIMAGALVWHGAGRAGGEEPSLQACAICFTEQPPGARFCHFCGATLPPPNPAPRYAGIGRRAAALLLDIAFLMPLIAVTGRMFPPLERQDYARFQQYNSGSVSAVEREDLMAEMYLAAARCGILIVAVSLPYFVLFERSAMRATLGKWSVGIQVVGAGGGRIGFGQAMGRYWARYLSLYLWLAGYMMARFSERRQTLHDALASTVVVRAQR